MPDFSDVSKVQELLSTAQGVENDNRERAREAFHFVEKRDGQWEPDIVTKLNNRPRYTFDKVGPIIDQIVSEIEQADFDIRIRPAGGDATKDTAKLYDGLIRDIESRSGATYIYTQASKSMVKGGLGGWLVKQEYVDDDSFDQDLTLNIINNFEDRVFFDEGAERQDMEDAQYGFLLTNFSKSRYEERWPDGTGQSVTIDNLNSVYYDKKDEVIVGQIWYKKPATKELILFSDGSVREDDDNLKNVMDELSEQGIVEEERRTRKIFKVFTRIFDGGGWLNDEQETVFHRVPIIPIFSNFEVREGKIIYSGRVERLIDPQRVYNYTRSREVEEVVLSPRPKYWMTPKQVQGHEAKLATMNTNADPVQLFNFDPDNPGPPQQNGGATLNPGLLQASQNAAQDLTEAGGLFGVNQGDIGDSPLSGIAIQSLQNKGDNSTIKYFKAVEMGIVATARILVKAIPKVYSAKQQRRILNEDGSYEVVSINDRVFDQQTGQWVTTNDLRKGKYDVTCDVGPAFKNRQQETVKALTEIVANDPAMMEMSRDVLLKNINSPGVDVVAERVRDQMVKAGLVPESQMTDEEKQMVAAIQAQGSQPSPEDKIAEAETARVQAETADVISKTQERQDKLLLQQQKQENDLLIASGKQELEQMRIAMQQQQATVQAMMDGQRMVVEALNQQADTLKTLREAMGADAVVSPEMAGTLIQQVKVVRDFQDDQDEMEDRTEGVDNEED